MPADPPGIRLARFAAGCRSVRILTHPPFPECRPACAVSQFTASSATLAGDFSLRARATTVPALCATRAGKASARAVPNFYDSGARRAR